MSRKIEDFIGKLTHDETVALAAAALDELPEVDAIQVVRTWIKANELEGEFGDD